MSLGIDLRQELERAVDPTTPLETVVRRLRDLRRQGATRAEARAVLEELRAGTDDGAREDRILEILDFVEGFCRSENVIWPQGE